MIVSKVVGENKAWEAWEGCEPRGFGGWELLLMLCYGIWRFKVSHSISILDGAFGSIDLMVLSTS